MKKRFLSMIVIAVMCLAMFAGITPVSAAIPTYCMDGVVSKTFLGGSSQNYFNFTYDEDAEDAPGGNIITCTRQNGTYYVKSNPYAVKIVTPLNVTKSTAKLNGISFDMGDVSFYIEFYMRAVKSTETQISQPKFDVILHTRSASTQAQTIVSNLSPKAVTDGETYGEWSKFTASFSPDSKASATEFRDTINSAISQTPGIGFQMGKDNTEDSCFQISGLRVIAYAKTANFSTNIQPLLDNGKLASVTLDNTSFGFSPDTYEYNVDTGIFSTVEMVKNALSVKPVTDGTRIVYDWPESIPGKLTVTTYPVSADMSDPAVAGTDYVFNLSTDYSGIPMAYEITDAYCEDGKIKTVTIRNNCSVSEEVNGYLASFNSNGRLNSVHDIGILSESDTMYNANDLNIVKNGFVKLFGFKDLESLKPLSGSQIVDKRLLYDDNINPENILDNPGFESGTTGWSKYGDSTVAFESYASDADEGLSSVHVCETSVKKTTGIRQDITDKVVEYGKGNYLVSLKVKGLEGCYTVEDKIMHGCTARINMTWPDGTTSYVSKTFAANNDWQAFNFMFPIDGTGIPSKVELAVYSSSTGLAKTNILYDDFKMYKVSETDGTPVRKPSKPSLILIGDSIATGYTNTASNPYQKGWGEYFGSMFDESKVDYFNFAVGGWSTKTFLQGNLSKTTHGETVSGPTWYYQKTLLKEGDMVVLSLGHNDEAITLANVTKDEFKANLKTFVDDIRDAGAEVVFVTSSPGRARNVDKTAETWENCLAEYAGYMKESAEENNVHVIDMNEIIYALECELASADINYLKTRFHLAAYDSDTDTYSGDTGHISYIAASVFARMVAERFEFNGLEWAQYLKKDVSESILYNGSFEFGFDEWDKTNASASLVTAESADGFFAASVNGTISQDISKLLMQSGAGEYRITGYIKGGDANIVVCGNSIPVDADNSQWSKIDTVITVSDVSSGLVLIQSSSDILLDGFKIVKK